MSSPTGLSARKAELIAASARARQDIRAGLAVRTDRGAPMARLLDKGRALLLQPAVLGALTVGLLAVGPRRLFRIVRWTAVVLPLHPLGRRLIPLIGARLLSALDDGSRKRDL